jgi:hypothetical protein
MNPFNHLAMTLNYLTKELLLDLFDFFYPQQAMASHLRKIAQRRPIVSRPVTGSVQSADVTELQDDVRFLTLVITALLRRFSETETASLADVQDLLDEIDGLDGVANSGLEPGVLRGLLGVLKDSSEDQSDADADADEFKIVTPPRYRKR